MEECEVCRFWLDRRRGDIQTSDGSRTGICRFNSPALLFVEGNEEIERRWPLAYSDEWCGKFEGHE